MPIYEYECPSCKKTYEIMQRFDDPPLQHCEICGGEVKKLISNTTFVLKGTGWYITDYARKTEEKADTPHKKTDEATKEETKSNGSSSPLETEQKKDVKAEPSAVDSKSE